jgi:alkylation response protein AidB-like acyl-CoA dehydrogenase
MAAIPDADEALRQPVRAMIAAAIQHVPTDRRARSWQGFDAAFSRALGQAGYLGLTLPTAYGGADRGPFARFVVVEELLAAGAPVAAHWIADRQSAPLILNYGTAAQRAAAARCSKGAKRSWCVHARCPHALQAAPGAAATAAAARCPAMTAATPT